MKKGAFFSSQKVSVFPEIGVFFWQKSAKRGALFKHGEHWWVTTYSREWGGRDTDPGPWRSWSSPPPNIHTSKLQRYVPWQGELWFGSDICFSVACRALLRCFPTHRSKRTLITPLTPSPTSHLLLWTGLGNCPISEAINYIGDAWSIIGQWVPRWLGLGEYSSADLVAAFVRVFQRCCLAGMNY